MDTRLDQIAVALRSRRDAEVVARGDDRYAGIAPGRNARFDEDLPPMIVQCSSVDAVAAAVRLCRRFGVRVTPRSGGHCFAGRSATAEVVIDVAPMRTILIDEDRVNVAAGAVLGELVTTLIPSGLIVPVGTCPSVGVGGFALGGGYGMLSRSVGLASDGLIAARIVLADGEVVDCDTQHEPDLFWALRGAGNGHFGVVTGLTFRTDPMPATVTIFRLAWPLERAAAVLSYWLSWLDELPRAISPSLVIRSDGARPGSVEVFGTMIGDEPETSSILRGMTTRVRPSSAIVQEQTYTQMSVHWARRAGEDLDFPRRRSGARRFEAAKSEFFEASLSPTLIQDLVSLWTVGRRPAEAVYEIDFSPWGGAYADVSTAATAFPHRDASYQGKYSINLPADAPITARADALRWLGSAWELTHDAGTGGVYPNFPDPDLADWANAYYGPNLPRLVQLKTRYDPDRVFDFRQAMPSSLEPAR